MSSVKTPSPRKIKLILDHSIVELALDVPPAVSISEAAKYVLSYLPKSVQQEIVALVSSDENEGREIPGQTGSYTVKTKQGYGAIYHVSPTSKTIVYVATPSELERFRMEAL